MVDGSFFGTLYGALAFFTWFVSIRFLNRRELEVNGLLAHRAAGERARSANVSRKDCGCANALRERCAIYTKSSVIKLHFYTSFEAQLL